MQTKLNSPTRGGKVLQPNAVGPQGVSKVESRGILQRDLHRPVIPVVVITASSHPVGLAARHDSARGVQRHHLDRIRGAQIAPPITKHMRVVLQRFGQIQTRRRTEETGERGSQTRRRGKPQEVQPGRGPLVRGRHRLSFDRPHVVAASPIIDEIGSVSHQGRQRIGIPTGARPHRPLTVRHRIGVRAFDKLNRGKRGLPQPDLRYRTVGVWDQRIQRPIRSIDVSKHRVPTRLQCKRLREPLRLKGEKGQRPTDNSQPYFSINAYTEAVYGYGYRLRVERYHGSLG